MHSRTMGKMLIFGAVIAILFVFALACSADDAVLEASLSFLGLGVQPPRTSWGVLLAEGYGYITRTFSTTIL